MADVVRSARDLQLRSRPAAPTPASVGASARCRVLDRNTDDNTIHTNKHSADKDDINPKSKPFPRPSARVSPIASSMHSSSSPPAPPSLSSVSPPSSSSQQTQPLLPPPTPSAASSHHPHKHHDQGQHAHNSPQRSKRGDRVCNVFVLAVFSCAMLVTMTRQHLVIHLVHTFRLPDNFLNVSSQPTTLDDLATVASRTPLAHPMSSKNAPFDPLAAVLPDTDPAFERGPRIRPVPSYVPRFAYPWRVPPRSAPLTPPAAHHRYLYTPMRGVSGEGLGHAMASVNADVNTAWRLGLVYTHRLARYGSITLPAPTNVSDVADPLALPYSHAAAVEHFFGWGADEVPREAVQRAICPTARTNVSERECVACDDADRAARVRELHDLRHGLLSADKDSIPRIDRVVEIPLNLSYHWPYGGTPALRAYRDAFLRAHPHPFTAFVMPAELCRNSPAYSKFRARAQAHFFHKYWGAHQSAATRVQAAVWGDDGVRGPPPPRAAVSVVADKVSANAATFDAYRLGATAGMRLPRAPRHPPLPRLRESELTIAVHARRGDFFTAGRPMVTTRAFARAVRRAVGVVRAHGGVFARMAVAVSVYSEGTALAPGTRVGHDVSKMTATYVDADGTPMDAADVERMLRDDDGDELGALFGGSGDRTRLRVALRTSENTVLCMHEMIGADLFVGSRSGLSLHIVGGLGRAAMQIVPWRDAETGDLAVVFNGGTGAIHEEGVKDMRRLWGAFADANTASAERALAGRAS